MSPFAPSPTLAGALLLQPAPALADLPPAPALALMTATLAALPPVAPASPFHTNGGRYVADLSLAARERQREEERTADRRRMLAEVRARHATAVLDRVRAIFASAEGLGEAEAAEILADLNALVGVAAPTAGAC